MPSWKRFFAALVLAPLAGGAGAAVVAVPMTLLSGPAFTRNWTEALNATVIYGFAGLLICFGYVLVVGLAAFLYARMQERTPPLGAALLAALLTGVVPFAWFALVDGVSWNALPMPATALLAALATAWTFWRVAFVRS